MKKFLLLLLTLIMVLTMAACGESDKDTDTDSENTSKAESVSVDKAEESEEDDGLLSEDEALKLAEEYWDWEEYTENGELVNYKSTQIDSDGEVVSGYYTFYLQWWNNGKWEDVDVVNVNRETGKCTYTLNGKSVSR